MIKTLKFKYIMKIYVI